MSRKKVLLGVTGGIAAYKSAELTRLLIKKNYDVQVIMTPAATEFISPLTFSSLSGNEVFCHQFEGYADRIKHIELAQNPAFIIIAPATYNTISKITAGIADNLLTTVIAASTVPVFLFPSMNDAMYENTVNKENLKVLEGRGFHILEPETGDLACGVSAKGRLPEPEKIIEFVLNTMEKKADFSGKNVLVTAGPTREPLDPVRYFGNHSSGKMGYAIARAFMDRGADVTVISGPTGIAPLPGTKTISVNTAEEMFNAVFDHFEGTDIVVKAAAVADYRPEIYEKEKIKKEVEHDLKVSLKRNPDILRTLGERKKNQIIIGFAAETENIITNAERKLKDKKVDFIVANDVAKERCGFEHETNEVTVIYGEGKNEKIPLTSKQEIAHKLLDIILRQKKEG